MKKLISKTRSSDWIYIVIGTALMALSTNLFYSPAGMVPGGFTGLAMVIDRLAFNTLSVHIPLWLGNMVLNIPLILFSIMIRGWQFLKRTFFASLLFSFWLYVLPEYALSKGDLFLTAVIGGAVMGLGLGFVFFGKATTGGTDTLAALVQHYFPHISVAKIMPAIDAVVILLSIWIFGLRVSLYAVLTVVLSGYIADGLISLFRNAYLVYIISNRHTEIAHQVMATMDRGVTLLPATGMYTTEERPVLFCAVSRKQAVILKDIVYENDPGAFLIMTDANEIRGEGFRLYSKEEL